MKVSAYTNQYRNKLDIQSFTLKQQKIGKNNLQIYIKAIA